MTYSTKYNHLYVMWYGPYPEVRIGCVEYLEPLLRSQQHITKSPDYTLVQEWLGTGLLTSTGKKWKKRRNALTGAFHFTILNDFVDIYKAYAKRLVKHFLSDAISGKAIDVQIPVGLAMLDVICETSMGVKVNALDSFDSEYIRAVSEVKRLLLKRMLNPFIESIYQFTSSGKLFYKHLSTLHNFTIDIINKNISSRNKLSHNKEGNIANSNHPYNKRKQVFLDILLDLYDKGEIDIDGIREEVDTFMFEGHDTTSAALSWTLYEIGRHPEIQKKLHDEIDSVSSTDCPLLDKIRSLKYMECVIKESLRLHPPVPGYGRTLEKDLVIGENVIPLGTAMAISVLSVHMNPAYWDNPSAFLPDRFESEDFLKRNPYCYIPFSAGPRNCIGQKFAMIEEKIFTYYILLNFKIKAIQTPDELEAGVDLIMHSLNGINIEFCSRN